MGVITKAYTTTIVAGLTAYASNVRRALDDMYDEFNGGINSANISAGFTHPASSITINDTADSFSVNLVEDALIEVVGSAIQDFTTIKGVGNANQQYAGHTFTITEPGTTATELTALYIFGDSASKTTDEVGTYTLDVCDANVVSGIMGISGGALLFTSSTANYATVAGLGNSFTSGFAIDFWVKPEQITATTYGFLFDKINSAADSRVYCYTNPTGNIVFENLVGGTIYRAMASNYFITGTGNEWTYVVCSQDSSNGVRLWVNGELAAVAISGTNSMNSGSDGDFYIGASTSGSDTFHGFIGNFRVRKKVISQKDVDVAYSTKYSLAKEYSNLDYSIKAVIAEDGNSDFIRGYDFAGIEVTKQSATIYRAGGFLTGFNTATTLKLIGKVA